MKQATDIVSNFIFGDSENLSAQSELQGSNEIQAFEQNNLDSNKVTKTADVPSLPAQVDFQKSKGLNVDDLDGFQAPKKKLIADDRAHPITNIKIKRKNPFAILDQSILVNSCQESSSVSSEEGEIGDDLKSGQLGTFEGEQSSAWHEGLECILDVATFNNSRQKHKIASSKFQGPKTRNKSKLFTPIIISWNIRDLNMPHKIKEVSYFISSNKPGIMVLLETKIKETNFLKIIKEWRNADFLTNNYNSSEGMIL